LNVVIGRAVDENCEEGESHTMKIIFKMMLALGISTFCHPAFSQETATTEPANTLAANTEVRGVIRALTEATVAVDYTAKVARLPILEGMAFKQGQVLITFDCRKNNAEVAAAAAGVKARDLVYRNNKRLNEKGAMGANEVQVSLAELDKARADVQAIRARTGSCDFKAPFSGRMVQRIVQEHETPAPNQPLIKIVDTTRLEVEAIVPSKWLSWIKSGETFSFKIDETGETVRAKVLRVGATVDPVSQTIQAYGVLIDRSPSVLPGMSGTATFAHSGG
jgi:membrane fusion protein, multidrug efflux system